jgi:hypothetical protein
MYGFDIKVHAVVFNLPNILIPTQYSYNTTLSYLGLQFFIVVLTCLIQRSCNIQGRYCNINIEKGHYDFFKFIFYVRDGHCGYSPWAPKNLDTSLVKNIRIFYSNGENRTKLSEHLKDMFQVRIETLTPLTVYSYFCRLCCDAL